MKGGLDHAIPCRWTRAELPLSISKGSTRPKRHSPVLADGEGEHDFLIDRIGVLLYKGIQEQGARMGKIQDLYNSRVRPMVPAERLQLARLILDDLATSENAVDVNNEWGDDDFAEVAAFSAQQADRSADDARSQP